LIKYLNQAPCPDWQTTDAKLITLRCLHDEAISRQASQDLASASGQARTKADNFAIKVKTSLGTILTAENSGKFAEGTGATLSNYYNDAGGDACLRSRFQYHIAEG
jgi:hypothetical protein